MSKASSEETKQDQSKCLYNFEIGVYINSLFSYSTDNPDMHDDGLVNFVEAPDHHASS